MKTIISLLTITITLTSCNQSIPNQEKVVEHLRQQMKNPDSFRMDSIKYTPYYLSDLKKEIAADSSMIFFYNKEITYTRDSIFKYHSSEIMFNLFLNQMFEFQRDSIRKSNHLTISLKKYNELVGPDKDTLITHNYKIYYMAQNSYGAMCKGSAFVSSNANLTPYSNGEIFQVSVD